MVLNIPNPINTPSHGSAKLKAMASTPLIQNVSTVVSWIANLGNRLRAYISFSILSNRLALLEVFHLNSLFLDMCDTDYAGWDTNYIKDGGKGHQLY
jgi:hypothetical protein